MPAVRARAPKSGAIPARLAIRAAALLALLAGLLAIPVPASAADSTASSARFGSASARSVTEATTDVASAALTDPFDGITVTVEDSLFLADRSMLPVKVSNAHTYQVRIQVTAWADSGRLDIDGTPIVVTVAPQTQTSVEFPATAVSNGTVTVSAAIVDWDGRRVLPSISRATFDIQAGWETPVVLVIAGLIVILAIIGVIRTIRRVRRVRRETGDGGTGDGETNGDGSDGAEDSVADPPAETADGG